MKARKRGVGGIYREKEREEEEEEEDDDDDDEGEGGQVPNADRRF